MNQPNISSCVLCNPDPFYQNLIIADYYYWNVSLHTNQSYLGRSIISLKRHSEDLFMIDQNEYLELQTITRSLTGAISDAFHADMFNYASLGNIIKHVHLHVVPRYAKSVKFGALSFHDHNWGSNYSPYDKSFIIEPEVVQKIKMKIIESL